MTPTAANVDILRQGWLDAASALAPGVDQLPELLEARLADAVREEQLDEQSLLDVVHEVGETAFGGLPPEETHFLRRRLQRAVYEYLLSLDALPQPSEAARETAMPHAHGNLIGAEEVAALGRGPASVHTAPPAAPPQVEADAQAGDGIDTGAAEAGAQPAAEHAPLEAEPVMHAKPEAAQQPAQVHDPVPDPEPEADPGGDEAGRSEPRRPRFTLFRRAGPASAWSADPLGEPAAMEPVAEALPAAEQHFVAPRSGFHLSDVDDFAEAPRANGRGPARTTEPAGETAPGDAADAPVAEPEAPASDAWHVRDEPADASTGSQSASGAAHSRPAPMPDDDDAVAYDDNRFEQDPEVVEARLEIQDRLRRRRCDEAAALLQRLASDVGGRALAELALDAGDRCRALGKNNAALSCYLAGSRADPVHETPLLRLADICIDDHDIDLAVSYLERVTRLRRLRGDDKGALRLYRKIVTVAPYRDDILATLMRAQATGRFED